MILCLGLLSTSEAILDWIDYVFKVIGFLDVDFLGICSIVG